MRQDGLKHWVYIGKQLVTAAKTHKDALAIAHKLSKDYPDCVIMVVNHV